MTAPSDASERIALPDIREVERWDREHRESCVEYHCTNAHRMLAFADWYIVIAHERDKKVATLRAERDRLRKALEGLRRGHYECEDCWYSCPKAEDYCNDNYA